MTTMMTMMMRTIVPADRPLHVPQRLQADIPYSQDLRVQARVRDLQEQVMYRDSRVSVPQEQDPLEHLRVSVPQEQDLQEHRASSPYAARASREHRYAVHPSRVVL